MNTTATTVKDSIGRPLRAGSTATVKSTREVVTVIGPTEGRRTLVDVVRSNGDRVSFYGSSLML
jgi:hypothetical protein